MYVCPTATPRHATPFTNRQTDVKVNLNAETTLLPSSQLKLIKAP
jgi:hypothetical protein